MGALLIAFLIGFHLFGFTLPNLADMIMRGFVGLIVIVTAVALIEPCSLLFSYHRALSSSLSE